ncbi:protein no-on-transient A isoform X1 [Drosophila mauritiana]|uniref:Protein no-on-transient A n=1 Tax=Drosophila mauritiana TaxID=7226 RepID=A0A6P8KPK6_DROMA|nr:protein no-on-transient A isoform X1 [Drosophila mauritiana]
MESAGKQDNNATQQLPQRQQRGNQQANKNLGKHNAQKQNDSADGCPAEKKQRFGGPNAQNQNQNQNQNGGVTGGGGAVGGPNQNKNFGNNKGGFAGNRNRNNNRAGNQNRTFPGNNNSNQKPNNEISKADGPNALAKNNEPATAAAGQNQANQNANKGQNQRQGQNQNQNQVHGQGSQGGPGNQGGAGNQGGQGNQGGAGNQGNGQGFRGRNAGNNQGGGFSAGPQNQQRDNRNRSGPRPGGGAGGTMNSTNMGGGGGGGGGGPRGGEDFFISQRLRSISGPTFELEPVEVPTETKFSGRNRLYVGNLTNDITDDELREMFKPYGEISEIFSNLDKNFTFLKVDYHPNAEKAKRALDGSMRKGRQLRVRFAPNATILRVSNLTPFVSNELLYKSFEIFGPIERASITVDDRGKHMGEGIVEFAKKSSASACLRMCNEKCFFLTASLRPCLVDPMEVNDDTDGLPEKAFNKKMPDFNQERSIGPRFADPNSFEHEYGSRWKQLHNLFKTKQDALKRELKMEEDKLEAQMEYARYEQETELLRQELRKREVDNERKKLEWEMREKQAEEMRKREEETMRRHQTEMQSHMNRQEEDMLRRQQETLFMKAQQLNSLLDQQEGFGGGGGNNSTFDNFAGNSNSPFEVFRGNNNNNSTMIGNNAAPNTQEIKRLDGPISDITSNFSPPDLDSDILIVAFVLEEFSSHVFYTKIVQKCGSFKKRTQLNARSNIIKKCISNLNWLIVL